MVRSVFSFGVLILAATTLFAPNARGATYNWVLSPSKTGDWSVASNWSTGHVPNGNDYAFISNNGIATVNLAGANCSVLKITGGGVNQTGGTAAASRVTQLYLALGSYNLVNNSPLTTTLAYVGLGSAASFNQSGGTHAVGNSLFIGYSGGSGTYDLSGGGLLTAANLNIGTFTSTGTLNQSSGATVIAQNVSMGTGTYNLGDGCLLSAGSLGLGGSFNQPGGTVALSGNLSLGVGTGSSTQYGVYTLSGKAQLSASNIYVGNGFVAGEITQSGHSTVVTQNLYVGNVNFGNPGGSSYTLYGGTVISQSNSFIEATFAQSAGTHVTNSLIIGYQGQTGTYLLNGNSTVSALNAIIGSYGPGNVAQSAGTFTISGSLYLGGYTSQYGGYFNLSGDATLSTQDALLSGPQQGPATMMQTGGTFSVTDALLLNSNSVYNLNGGMLTVSALSSSAGCGTFNFNGGTLQARGTFSSTNSLYLGTPDGDATVYTSGNTATLAGSLCGPGNLVHNGNGTLILSGFNTYTGGTTVAEGRLIVMSPQSLASGTDLVIGDTWGIPAPIVAVKEITPSVSSVPEPGGVALVSVAALVAMGCGIRRKLFTRPPAQAPAAAASRASSGRRLALLPASPQCDDARWRA
jgi:autotransporter-associated beta strand protein